MTPTERLMIQRAMESLRETAKSIQDIAPLASMQASKLARDLELRLERAGR